MPRRLLIATDKFPYHVTARSNNREWFYLPINLCWELFRGQLVETSVKYAVEVFAFVLMSNHFHLILRTPQSNLGEVMRHFLTGVSKGIQKTAHRINHIFGARYKWSLLCDGYAVAYVYKYVLRNPARAGLVETVEAYPFSTAHEVAIRSLPLFESLGYEWRQVPRPRDQRLKWLNQPTHKDLESLIARALRQENFRFSQDNAIQKRLRELKRQYGVESL